MGIAAPLFASALLAFTANAREIYPPLLPNGLLGSDESSGFTCAHFGHEECIPGNTRNQFGLDFVAAGREWTTGLCEMDSDGDGLTNGEEMGDPCCVWTEGAETEGLKGFRSENLSHPGEKSETNTAPKCDEDAKEDGNATDTEATTSTNEPAADGNEEATGEGEQDDDDDDDVCFPASASVETEAGFVSMESLSIGDRVRVADGSFSDVFMFSHQDPVVTTRFLELRTASGRALTATSGHYILVNGRGMVAAKAVRVGDLLRTAEGEETAVTRVSEVTKTGLFNPQTVSGDIVVDGLVASTYTTAIQPTLAHVVLSPLRAIYRLMGLGASLPDGSPVGVNVAIGGSREMTT